MSQYKEIKIPHNFELRTYQEPLWQAMDRGVKRLVAVWHRRAGKDKTIINIVTKEMFRRVGAYYYFFPTYQQGKKILWEGRDRDGFKFLDHIPESVRKRTDNSEMLIETKNGSIFQIVGTDRYDAIRGTNPVGCVFSEFSYQDPMAWDIVRPILAENGGWAIFEFTPNGENHGFDIYELARESDHWFCELLTVDDTQAIDEQTLEVEREEIIAKYGNDALYQQEYMCSFKTPVIGAYYLAQLMKAEAENRICNVPYDPIVPVDTWWDLGINDSTAIWFTQVVGQEVHVIDYYENQGEGLQHYGNVLQDKRYVYGKHHAPHDIEARELGTGKSRKETAKSMGIDFQTVPKIAILDGIECCRNVFPRCWFDKEKTKRGVNALKSYRKEYDEKNKTYKKTPKHDWASNGADAFRTFGVGFRHIDYVKRKVQKKNQSVWDKHRSRY